MFLAEWIAWMESARRDLYFEPDRRRFWEGLGRSGLEGEESALRGLIRSAGEHLLVFLAVVGWEAEIIVSRRTEGMDGKRRTSAAI